MAKPVKGIYYALSTFDIVTGNHFFYSPKTEKMETKIQITPIGKVNVVGNSYTIEIDEKYRSGLTSIVGFTHLQIIWWAHLLDNKECRATLITDKPYKKGPDKIGVFATRSPVRPNPILITNIFLSKIDLENGIIHTPYIDAEKNSPVLDIKPYHFNERVKNCKVPDWCSHWPQWYEDSATFDWQNEFNF